MYFKKTLLILLLANVALAISCRDRDKDKIDEGNGFFLRKAEIDCKREQECFPDLFQNNWDGSYDTCYERTFDPDEAEYLVRSMKCSYDSEAGKGCLESLRNLTCDATEAELTAAQQACDAAWTCPLFECASGDEEIYLVWQCDGTEDCRDGSDEANCTTFYCDYGDNIPYSAVCDGTVDCEDGTDEEGCDDDDGFRCDDGAIIPPQLVCDFFQTCPDNSDEENCEEYTCDEGATVVPAAALCDGVLDCNDGLDESNCSN